MHAHGVGIMFIWGWGLRLGVRAIPGLGEFNKVFKKFWTRLPCYAHNAEMKEGETLEDFDYMLSMNDISWTSPGITMGSMSNQQ